MTIDVFKPRGKLKRNQPGAGVASVIQVPIICTVMSTVDPTHQGRIAVYPSENNNKDAYNSDNWIWVGKLATFAGQTAPIGPDDTGEYGTYTQNPSSYGQWNAPPDKETQVICIFVNGDPNYGFYIGTIPKPETLSMIPAIGAFENVTLSEGEAQSYGGATRLPTTNINTNNDDIANSVNYLKDAKPVHSYTASIMQQQGVLRDKYRGPIGSSATREASSRVGWGVSTPGRPVYLGGATDEDIPSRLGDEPEDFRVVTRRGGHSLVMDDGDIIGRDQLIRLRTALGHQILMSDDGQMLSILHSNGQSYIELGKEGTVDVFSTNSVNIRTQGDLNLHADETLNLSAKNVNINSSENTVLNADKEFKQRVGEDYSLYAIQDLKIKADAALAIEAEGQVGIKSGAEIFNEGTKIHLNDGAASLSPDVIEPIELIMHPDTLFDDVKGWAAALAKLPSITSRAPAHMPWMNANQGADVQVDPSAAGALPASPVDTIADLNADLAGDLGGPTSLPNPTTAASISEVSGISKSLDKNATSQMLSGVLSDTIDNLGAFATTTLGGTLTNMTNNAIGPATTAAVGLFGQTPSQMTQGGILKPGADIMVNTLISANAGDIGSKSYAEIPGVSNPLTTDSLSSVMPASIFSGKAGVNSLQQFTNSSGAQAKSAVQVMQKGQKALQTLGAMTGKESPGGVGAIVQGTMSTLSDKGNLTNNVKDVSTIITKSIGSNDNIPASATQVLNSMKTGATAMLASELSGGAGGIISALDTLNTSGLDLPGVGADLNIGAAASSFKSIVNSFPVLPANSPVDLAATAGAAAAAVAGASAGMTGLDLVNTDSISSGLADAVGAGGAGIDSFSGALTTASGAAAQIAASGDPGAVAAINNAVSDINAIAGDPTTLTQQGLLQAAALNVQTGTSSKISGAIASGVSQLPGGQKLAGSIVNNALGAVNPISDGLGKVTDALSDLGADAYAGIDAGNLAYEGLSGLGSIKDDFNSMTDQLTGKVTGALSSALSPGTTAALQSALSSLTAGGGSTIKLPVVAVNTYDRSSITNLIDSVLGDPIVPRPNLLGEIPSGTISAINTITQLKKTLSNDIQQLSVLSKGIAKTKAALFEAQTNFPAGSPEIAAAEAAYQQAASSTTYATLVQKVKAAEQQFNTVSVDLTIQPETNPFSDIENLLDNVSSAGNTADSFASESDNNNSNIGDSNYTLFSIDDIDQTDKYYDENTYSNILATIAKTYVPKDKTQFTDEPYSTDYKPVITGYPAPDNTVESVTGEDIGDGPLTVTDGQGGVGQDVYTDYGIITVNENTGVGGGGLKWYYNGTNWKLK